MKKQIRKQESGFTLIELVLVIIVLGVLAATAIPKFVNLKGEAVDASAKNAEGVVKGAYGMFLGKNKTFPTLDDLAAAIDVPNTAAHVDYTGLDSVATTLDGISIVLETDSANNPKTEALVSVFTDEGCSVAPTVTTEQVLCIQGITTTVAP